MTTTRTRSAHQFAKEIASASEHRNKYNRMLSLALELGLEYEIERMRAGANEMDAEIDYLIEQAIMAGYDCDDIEAAA